MARPNILLIHSDQQRYDVDDWTWDDWAPVVSRYRGGIRLLEVQLGWVLDALERLDLTKRTMVIYTTDHGDMCGGHGMIDKHFITYDDVVRVQLFVRWPGQILPGNTCDAFVSHSIDLVTTFCEAASAEVPDTFRGRSLLPVMRNEKHGRPASQGVEPAAVGRRIGAVENTASAESRFSAP